ncbi:hypothetical protein [Nocardia abscessus]|uniref:hypothetical protein n=1 Tax=Nocardia abscessus TaxID=120957 RepID=UPI002456AC8B|nr:hypothetical protein [Nocardia abscessus]
MEHPEKTFRYSSTRLLEDEPVTLDGDGGPIRNHEHGEYRVGDHRLVRHGRLAGPDRYASQPDESSTAI